MPVSSSSRAGLAATVLLALFSSAYLLALRWAGPPSGSRRLGADHAVLPATAIPAAFTPPPKAPPAVPPEQRDTCEVVEYGSPQARRPRRLHRYVGTVGGEPITALLEWQNPDSVSGSFYGRRRGPVYFLELPDTLSRRRGAVMHVHEGVAWGEAGEWQLHGRPGARLTGTWRGGPTGRPQPFVLREHYAGAVQLAVRTEWRHGRTAPGDPYGHAHSSVAWVMYEFLQLLHPAAVPAALRPLLAPGPAARRRRLRMGSDGDIYCATSYRVRVALNEGGLLGYQYAEECSPLGSPYSLTYHNALLDMGQGRWLAPQSQLIATYEPALARLLARRLLYEPGYRPLVRAITRDSSWQRPVWQARPARPVTLLTLTRWLRAHAQTSAAEALFTGAGLEIDDAQDLFGNAMQTTHFTWFVPYTELRPLVRPGTPLARMLQVRGMW